MGDLESGDHQPDGRLEPLLEDPADLVEDGHEVVHEVGVEVDPVIDLLDRHDQRVARLKRVDRQEGHRPVVPPHESSG